MKKQIRRSREERYVRVQVMIPKGVFEESKGVALKNYPSVFYNFSHYVTCALIRQNEHFGKD